MRPLFIAVFNVLYLKGRIVNKFKLSVLTSIIVLSIGVNASDEPVTDIEKISVTGTYVEGYQADEVGGASKLALSIVEIPQSVSVITSAQMNDFQLKDINSALYTATGINVESVETDRTYYTARGFDVTNFQIDGVGLPLTSGNNHADEDTAIYERIEVIRGANGLMTGVGNPSATVNFIRKRATKQEHLNITATLGSWNKKRLEIDASTPISDDIGTRFVAVKQKNDSYLDRYQQDKTVLYGFVDWNISESTNISISHSYNESDANGNNWGANPLFYTDGSATNYARSINTSADWSNWRVVKNNTVVELSHMINAQWDIRTTYSHKRTSEDAELLYAYSSPERTTGLGLLGWASEYVLEDDHDLFDAYIHGDFRLFGREHQLVAGVNYSDISYIDRSLYDNTTGNGYPVFPALEDWRGDVAKPIFADGERGSKVTNRQKAAYFTARWNLFDGFHFITGGRYNDWEVVGTSYDVPRDAQDSEFIPYLGGVYQITPELSAYASYTETFLSQNKSDINGESLAPLEGESKEIGFKHEFYDGLLVASAAYFDVTQNNFAVDSGQRDAEKVLYQAVDGIRSHGVELEVAGQVAQGWQISAGITDINISGGQTEAGSADNTVRDYTPAMLFKLATAYDVQRIDGLTLGMSLRWQDDISRIQGVVGEGFANTGENIITQQKAYSVINLMASYDLTNDIALSFNTNNITDEKYLKSLYWAQSFYAAPANYSATLSWSL